METTPLNRLLRLASVCELTALGKTKLYELEKAGLFPARVQLTERSVAWREQEVRAFIDSRPRKIDAGNLKPHKNKGR